MIGNILLLVIAGVLLLSAGTIGYIGVKELRKRLRNKKKNTYCGNYLYQKYDLVDRKKRRI